MPTAQRGACETWNACSFWGVGGFRPKFYGNGVIPCQNVYTIQYIVDCATICCWKFLDDETIQQTFNAFLCKKNAKFGYLNPILGTLGMRHNLGWWLVGKAMFNFLFALVELFCCLLRFRSYEAKCVSSSAVFARVDLFALAFYLDMVVPHQPFVRKLETLGDPTVKTVSLCVPSFWHNTGVWWTNGRTYGRTDLP